jgi:hypothetical protein
LTKTFPDLEHKEPLLGVDVMFQNNSLMENNIPGMKLRSLKIS